MSGFVVGFGNPSQHIVQDMMETIHHRGPDKSGRIQVGKALMAQNYLRADGAAVTWINAVPVQAENGRAHHICYDGQMGNWRELAHETGVEDGPLREERLLLQLHAKYGAELLKSLNDTIFTVVISDGNSLLAARDLLGIKTLFYGWKDDTLYFASELKALLKATDDVHEFPPGHYMTEDGALHQYAQLPDQPPAYSEKPEDEIVSDVRTLILTSFQNRIDFAYPTGSLLSGGIDSSVVAAIASAALKEQFGKDSRLQTFALGVGESQDILNARKVAERLGSIHHELLVTLDDMLAVLPEVIYYLESFDPSLVRSAASNFMISRYAREKGIEVLLSGEGGDEVFCGYIYLKDYPPERQFSEQMRCLGFLHSNASLRLDRMNQCNGVRVVAPLISGRLLDYAVALPPDSKQRPDGIEKIEKWVFRKAFENDLPHEIVWRLKQEFSQGSGSAGVLPNYFDARIPDDELEEAQAEFPVIRSKEELAYFRMFAENFGTGKAVQTVGQWVLL